MNKSKFLKKSLAMLLALMLVVAMIPLSASAALPEDLTAITVNGVNVSLDAPTVEVKQDQIDAEVEIGLNGPLARGWFLRAVTSGSTYREINSGTMKEGIDRENGYVNVSGNTGTMTLQLVNKNTEKETVEATYTLTLNYVKNYTTTNIELVKTGNGVYSAEIDNEEGVVNVVLARNNTAPQINGTPVDEQKPIPAEISVKGLQGATVAETVKVDEGETFDVTAEDGTVREWKVNVVSYLDAFSSFAINGEEGVFVDKDEDNIIDTIVVTLPKETIEAGLTYPVTYKAEGNQHCDVDIDWGDYGWANPETNITNKDVQSGDEVTFNGVTTSAAGNGIVRATRLGASQYYMLVVQPEKDLDTTITYARMDRTNATIDGQNISAVLPAKVNAGGDNQTESPDTKLEEITLTLYTSATVTKVYAAGEEMKNVATDPLAAGAEGDQKVWVSNPTVDLSKGPISVVVYAEDDTKSTTYTVSATKADRADDAKLESFYLMDDDGNSYGGVPTGKTVNIVVPYMTFDVADWTVLAKASNNAKLQVLSSDKTEAWDIVSGVHEASDVSLGGEITTPQTVKSITVRAIDKNDSTIYEDYTVNVKLSSDYAKGNELQNVRFTAQMEKGFDGQARTNSEFTDAIVRDENEFGTEVVTNTDQTHTVETLNIEVPKALSSENGEATYVNAVTEVVSKNGGVVFYQGKDEDDAVYMPISVLPDNDNVLSATKLQDGDKILVLDEEVARYAMVKQHDYTSGYQGINPYDPDHNYDGKTIASYGTEYTVKIHVKDPSSAATLESFQVGTTELDVDNSAQGGTISGTIPWGLTNTNSMFAEFELSKYALLTTKNGEVVFFSNGDVDGDGNTDTIPAWSDSVPNSNTNIYNKYKGVNRQFYFERVNDDKHTVKVYYTAGGTTKNELTEITVLAEDRLGNGKSKKTYKFDLTWAEPETEADILTFKLDGYTGTIDDSDPMNRTITVKNVPYGTDVTGMIAEFTTTPNAKVYLTNPDGVLLESGVTSINYTNPVLLYVESEDTKNSNSYTVTIDMGLTFSDIDEDDWFYDDVVDAANEGYVEGMGDGKYEPKGSLTRAQFATMIARAMNYEDKPASPAAFTDVNGHWAADAINFCAENGIVDGYEDCTFKPDRAVTRQEVAAMLTRAFDLVEVSDDKYPDDASISGWASEYVYKCLAAGLMKGDKDTGNFRPASILNRAEAATILMNANREGIID